MAYTLTFGTPTVGTDSATLPFTLDSAVTDGPYKGTASATGGGETKTGDVTVDANSTTGEIVFTGLSAGTTYTIAQGRIDVTYGGNDRSLSHGGTSFTTASDEPKTAVQSQWQDLVSKVKAKANSADLATVATSGSYNDLSNKPTIPTVPTKCFYGTCSTAKGTAAKVVTCSSFTAADLVAGTRIVVLMSAANTYNGTATLNINNTGAHDIYYNGTTTNARYMWNAGESVDFIFNGSQWATVDGALATTDYYGVTKLYNGAGSSSNAYALTPNSLYSFANNSIAPYYSASSTYAVGDKVRYGYKLYSCSTAISTAEAWNSSHWTELDTLQEQIDSIDGVEYYTLSALNIGPNNLEDCTLPLTNALITTLTTAIANDILIVLPIQYGDPTTGTENCILTSYTPQSMHGYVFSLQFGGVPYKMSFNQKAQSASFTKMSGSSSGTITEVQANGTSVATSGVANIPAASTSAYGVTKLSTSTSSTSTSLAATPSAVKSAYDLANGKQDALVSGTNIKTINNTSILGSGNIDISTGTTYTAGDNITISNQNVIDTADTVPLIGSTLSSATSAYVDTDNIVNGAVTPTKLAWTEIIDKIYPIGSIYMSVTLSTAAQVEAVLGGTWVAWGAGRVPVGVDTFDKRFDNVEETGGSKTHTHPLGVNSAAGIRNYGDKTYVVNGADGESLWRIDGTPNSVWVWSHNSDAPAGTDLGHTGVRLYGRTETTESLPPYITCYMYKRTA